MQPQLIGRQNSSDRNPALEMELQPVDKKKRTGGGSSGIVTGMNAALSTTGTESIESGGSNDFRPL